MKIDVLGVFLCAWLCGSVMAVQGAAEPTAAVASGHAGAEIYQKHCAECHGAKGQGVAGKFDEALFGERSLEGLAKYIDKNMPEDNPDAVDAAQSLQIAAFMHESFYSAAARAKHFPPTRAASRLTVRQYAESVADLLGSFSEPKPPALPGGLKAVYFRSDGMNKKAEKILEREDGKLEFDFADREPVPGLPPEQYSVAWQGSLLPAETGWYEFRVATPNGARLYLNTEILENDTNARDDAGGGRQPAFIDLWVSSGAEVRTGLGRKYMLGGRGYPLRLDYFKYKDKLGSVKLEWKPPHGVWTVLASPFLSPQISNPVPVVDVAFPADDASVGYERGTDVSRPWHEAASKSALEMADSMAKRLPFLLKIRYSNADATGKVKEFMGLLAERAFRRPLDATQLSIYVEKPFAEALPLEEAAKQGILRILSSPRFLYPEFGQPEDPYLVATRLALTLWDSLPDAVLLEAAKNGGLRDVEQRKSQARRMVEDPRAKAKLREFFATWLNLEEGEDLSKDVQASPGFNEHVAADLRRSLLHFVEHVVHSAESDFRNLLQADYLFLNKRLADLYGLPGPQGEDFELVRCDPAQRAGILTHPFLLSAFAYNKSSSPIHRGVFLTRHVMGRTLRPPPMAIEFMDDRFDPSLTMREKVTELTNKQSCSSCHTIINPLGFSLENFDAIGKFRTTDNNKPVNAVAEYVDTEGKAVTLRGPRDLAQLATQSGESRRGFARQLFQFMVKQAPAAYGTTTIEKLEERFLRKNCHIRELMVHVGLLSTEVSGPAPLPPPSAPPVPTTPTAATEPTAAAPAPVAPATTPPTGPAN